MTTELKFGVDLALVVLIWLVQLIIYPSFNNMNEGSMDNWHSSYMKRITVVVFPLMLTQLLLSWGFLFKDVKNPILWVNTVLVMVTWILTFVQFVPLHNRLEKVEDKGPLVEKLIESNWYRTIIWTVIFLLNFWPG